MGGACSSSTRVDAEQGGVSSSSVGAGAGVGAVATRPELSNRAKAKEEEEQRAQQQKEEQREQKPKEREHRKSLLDDVTELAGNVLNVLSEGMTGKDERGGAKKNDENDDEGRGQEMKSKAASPKVPYKPDSPRTNRSKTSTSDLRFMLAKGDSLNDIGGFGFGTLACLSCSSAHLHMLFPRRSAKTLRDGDAQVEEAGYQQGSGSPHAAHEHCPSQQGSRSDGNEGVQDCQPVCVAGKLLWLPGKGERGCWVSPRHGSSISLQQKE